MLLNKFRAHCPFFKPNLKSAIDKTKFLCIIYHMENYLTHLYTNAQKEKAKSEKEKFEEIFAKYFSFSCQYLSKNDLGLNKQLRSYLVAFANVKQITKFFEFLKNCLVKEAIYNKDYWHLTDGYLSESEGNFNEFLHLCFNYSSIFSEIILDLFNDGDIENLGEFLLNAIDCFTNIINNAENVEDLSSYQFAEITLLKQIIAKLKELLIGLQIATNLS